MTDQPASATRITAFAFISAIEQDLRDTIAQTIPVNPSHSILPPDAHEAAVSRRARDTTTDSRESLYPQDLLPYCDFADLAKILIRNNEQVISVSPDLINIIAPALEKATGPRNRVAHSRPLEPEDLPHVIDLANQIRNISAIDTSQIDHTLECYSSRPEALLNTSIPDFWQDSHPAIEHNLPTPEFYETGFIGRREERRYILRLLKGSHPVISLIGVGGIGKTALAQRCLFDLIEDDENAPFDAIVWVSLKTEKLTQQGVRTVTATVADTLPIVRDALTALGTPDSQTFPDATSAINELTEHLREFRVLLALDNCEAVSRSTIEPLLGEVPQGSKLLMTSRTGLGAYEWPFHLEAMRAKESHHLFREFARHHNLLSLAQGHEDMIDGYCKSLFYNPLAIKWFVASAASGKDPKSLLPGKGTDFDSVLEFCFDNVFSTFDQLRSNIVATIIGAGRPVSRTELCLFLQPKDYGHIDLALSELRYCSVLETITPERHASPAGETTSYTVGEFARRYAKRQSLASDVTVSGIRHFLRQLKSQEETARARAGTYKYQWNSISVHDHDEGVVAGMLHKAIAIYKSDVNAAFELSEQARSVKPEYSEAHRILAHLYSMNGDPTSAEDFYLQAIEVNPDSDITRYQYAFFLIDTLTDYESALDQLDNILAKQSDDFVVLANKARCLSRLGHYPEATDIWESLLERLSEVPTRQAIMTLDQAVESYRRWCEQDAIRKERQDHLEHAHRALSLLTYAYDNNYFDDTTWKRVEKVLSDVARLLCSTQSSDLWDAFRVFVEVVRRRTRRKIKLYCDTQVLDQCICDMSSGTLNCSALNIIEDPARIARSVSGNATSTDIAGVYKGEIEKLEIDRKFGFIRASDNEKYFFHRNHLTSARDWDQLEIGTQVRFELGTNSEGACATNVAIND